MKTGLHFLTPTKISLIAASSAFMLGLLTQTTASAATYTWTGGSSGTWDTTATNWSGGSGWATGATGTAVLNTAGVTVTVSNSVYAGGLTLASNATVSSGTIVLGGASDTLTVNAGVTGTVGAFLSGSGTGTYGLTITNNGNLTLASGSSNVGSGLYFTGSGTTTYASGTAYSNQLYINGGTIIQGAATVTTGRLMIGFGASGTSTYTVNNANASLTSNGSSDSLLGRGGDTGVFNISSGTVSISKGLDLVYDTNTKSNAIVNISGGTTTIGGTTYLLGINSGTTGQYATFNLSGGTVTMGALAIGGAYTYDATTSASFNMTGGTLYIGAGGIIKGTNLPGSTTINLGGGTIGSSSASGWSSSMDMILTGSNGDITFLAADSSGNARTITLNGVLSGTGGLVKSGSGALILNGTNSYTGATAVNSGTLSVNGAIASTSNLTIASKAVLAGSGTISSVITNSGTISGSLTFGNDATINTGGAVTGGTFNGNITNNGNITSDLFVLSGRTLAGSGTTGKVSVTSGTVNGNGLKMGAATLYGLSTLSGINTVGGVTIAGGTTSLTGTTTLTGTSQVSVSVGASLNNNGLVTGNISVSGILKSSGAITGNLVMDPSGTGTLAIGGTATGVYDQIKVSGNVSLNGALDLKNLDLSGLTKLGDKITLIDNTGTGTTDGWFATILTSGSTYLISGSSSAYTFTVGSTEYELNYAASADSGDSVYNDVTLTVVPEPETWAILVGGAGMLGFVQRLRRRRD